MSFHKENKIFNNKGYLSDGDEAKNEKKRYSVLHIKL